MRLLDLLNKSLSHSCLIISDGLNYVKCNRKLITPVYLKYNKRFQKSRIGFIKYFREPNRGTKKRIIILIFDALALYVNQLNSPSLILHLQLGKLSKAFFSAKIISAFLVTLRYDKLFVSGNLRE